MSKVEMTPAEYREAEADRMLKTLEEHYRTEITDKEADLLVTVFYMGFASGMAMLHEVVDNTIEEIGLADLAEGGIEDGGMN